MILKDYYAILEIPVSADLAEIKKAYRRLALLHHPDKANNDPYAAARFAEIKEAYEVLTNPGRKEKYLQHRWYNQSTGTRRTQQTLTPENILKQAIELEKYVSMVDAFRMDAQGLHDYIRTILDNDTIGVLNGFHDTAANDRIAETLVRSMKLLPQVLLGSLEPQLQKLDLSEKARQDTQHFFASHRIAAKRDAYRIWIILLIVLLLCALIFLIN